MALGVLAVVVVVRIATLGESRDPALQQAVRAELLNELGNELGKVLDGEDVATDPAATARALQRADPDNIRIHALHVSKPLLSFSSNAEAVVKVEYSLPGVDRHTEHWRFRHSMIGGWAYRGGSTAVSYWLNFF